MVEVLRIRADLVARAFQRFFLSFFKRPFQAHLLIKLLIIEKFGYIDYIYIYIYIQGFEYCLIIEHIIYLHDVNLKHLGRDIYE